MIKSFIWFVYFMVDIIIEYYYLFYSFTRKILIAICRAVMPKKTVKNEKLDLWTVKKSTISYIDNILPQ